MKAVNKILGYFIAALVGMMVVLCCWQVITRFVLNSPSKYTEELLRYALIWMTMLGVPYAYGQERHIAINIFTKGFEKRGSLMTKVMIEIIVITLCLTVFVIGGILVTLNSAGQISPALQMPMPLYYIGLPISGGLTILYSIHRLSGFIKSIKEVA